VRWSDTVQNKVKITVKTNMLRL